jgi:hypothetical protein
VPTVLKSGSLNLLELSGPVQTVMGLLYLFVFFTLCILEKVLYTMIHTNNEEVYEIPISSYTNQ